MSRMSIPSAAKSLTSSILRLENRFAPYPCLATMAALGDFNPVNNLYYRAQFPAARDDPTPAASIAWRSISAKGR